MKRNAPLALFVLAGLMMMLVACGCTTVRQEFDGYDSGHVWSAMTAVAESPQYENWRVITNEVWRAPDEARMEVYRELHRAVREPGRKPRIEQREWRFRIEMLDTDPPSARLISRGWGVPAHARIETDRYFRDVRQMLGERPARTPEAHPSDHADDDPTAQPEEDHSQRETPEADDRAMGRRSTVDDVTGRGEKEPQIDRRRIAAILMDQWLPSASRTDSS